MKKNRDFHYRVVGKCKSMLSISYMTTFLLLSLIGIGSKQVCAQEHTTISLSLKNATIQDVLWAIEKQTKFVFVYNEEDLNQVGLLDVKFQGTGVEEVLKYCLKGTNLEYIFQETIIVIKPKNKKDAKISNSMNIKGKVVDQDSIPLPGVTILLKGTSMGCVTDKDGNYRMSIPGGDKRILLFSFIGMKTREVLVTKDTSVVNILLETDVTAMDEVVITGYEVIDKRKLTSSITTLKSDEIMEPVKSSLDQMLQGKVAGMSVMMASSTPGAAPKIRIRGSSSIVGNREPLWVLDGIILEDPVPLDVTELNSMDRVNLIGNAISGLNPEDIERIDVLKDASATAIYGTKAANGVIVITTKRGKTGPPSIRYSTSLGFIARPRVEDMRLMDSKERIEVSEEMHARGLHFVDMSPSGDIGYEGRLMQLWNNEITYNEFSQEVAKLKMTNTDWYKLLFRNAFNQNHTISASGANDKINYYFSLGYGNNQGAEKKVGTERFNFSSSLDLNVTEKLKIGLKLNSSFNTNERFHSSIDLYNYAYSTSRAISPYNENGSYHFHDKKKSQITDNPNLIYNIFNELENSGNVNKTISMNSQVNMDYNMTSFLRFNFVLAYAKSVNKQREYATEESFYVATYRNTNIGEPLPKAGTSDRDYVICPFGGILDESNMENSSYTGRFSLSLNQAWEKHSISGSIGIEARSSHYEGLVTRNYGYIHDRGKTFVQPDPMKDWLGYLKELGKTVPRITDKQTNTMSYYATFSYGYDSRYIFNVNVRGDGSNKLGEEEGNFLPIWSVSGRWNTASEHFMHNCMWINELSFRASLGVQGNVTDAHNPNMVISLGSLDTRSGLYESRLSSLPNPGLLWEKTVSYNLGVDFSIFNRALSGSLEYYEKKGKDQLTTTQIASTNGATSVVINNGTMENKGWELSLSATPVQTKSITWGLTFNTGKNWNKVTGAEDTGTETYMDYLSGSLVRNGKAVNSFYSYRYKKLDANGLPVFLGVKAKDDQGNTLIASVEEAYEKGLVFSGKREADLTGGISTYFRYKKLSLNMNFAFSLGAHIRLNDLFTSTRMPMPSENMQDEFVGRWRNPGDEAHTDIPALWDGNPTYTGMFSKNGSSVLGNDMWEMYDNSDLRVVSGDFLRCRGISLSYTVADFLVKKIGMKGLTLGCGISNPFVIKSKDLKGRDPEQVDLGSGAIPPQPTYSFSLSATF